MRRSSEPRRYISRRREAAEKPRTSPRIPPPPGAACVCVSVTWSRLPPSHTSALYSAPCSLVSRSMCIRQAKAGCAGPAAPHGAAGSDAADPFARVSVPRVIEAPSATAGEGPASTARLGEGAEEVMVEESEKVRGELGRLLGSEDDAASRERTTKMLALRCTARCQLNLTP